MGDEPLDCPVMPIRRKLLVSVIVVALAVSAAAGCIRPPSQGNAGATNVPAQTSTAASPQPSATPALYEYDTRTGIEPVDNVLGLLQIHDLQGLRSLIQMSNVPCTHYPRPMSGDPWCPEDAVEGTVVSVFPAASCEPAVAYSRQDASDRLTSTVNRSRYLHSVYVSLGFSTPEGLKGWPEKAYVIVLVSGSRDRFAPEIFLNSAGSIVELYLGCRPGPPCMPDAVRHGVASYILPPPGC